MAKCLPTMRETRVPSLGWDDPLEKEMADNSCTLAWKIPWTEEPSRLQSMESQRVSTFTFTFHLHELEKEMATHSSILAWKIPWAEEPGGLYSTWGLKESDRTERLTH